MEPLISESNLLSSTNYWETYLGLSEIRENKKKKRKNRK